MNIYVASSWRNTSQPGVVKALREGGHKVYDFRDSVAGDAGVHSGAFTSWEEIDPKWPEWSPEAFRSALGHPIAKAAFEKDMSALQACDACVLVLPCGRSAHLELGYAIGKGKWTIALLDTPVTPELMYLACDRLAATIDEVLKQLALLAARDLDYGEIEAW